MKKNVFLKLFVLLMCLLFLLVFPSCGQDMIDESTENEPTVVGYQVMRMNAARDALIEDSFDPYLFWIGAVEQGGAPESVTVTFDGKEYTGTYLRSKVSKPKTFVSYRYMTDDGVIFETNSETGELTYISMNVDIPKGFALKESHCREIADEIAEQYIALDEYLVECKVSDGLYTFYYYRAINGIKTSDGITVSVCGDGNILFFEALMVNAFADVSLLPPDTEAIMDAVEKSFVERYEGYVSHQLRFEPELWVLEDGTFAYMYIFDVQCNVPYTSADIGDGETTYVGGACEDVCRLLIQPIVE